MRWLVAAFVLAGCCIESGPPRLSDVRIESDFAIHGEPLSFSGEEQSMTPDAFFAVSRVGSPEPGRLRTIPMLEMVAESDGAVVTLDRFTDSVPQSCGAHEIYDPVDEQLVIGERYLVVHRATASPGALEDSGAIKGALSGEITSFDGEPALVAVVRITGP